eukprot:bmy_04575T0
MSTRPGLYYGQCSEICGSNHSFMPIVFETDLITDTNVAYPIYWVNQPSRTEARSFTPTTQLSMNVGVAIPL